MVVDFHETDRVVEHIAYDKDLAVVCSIVIDCRELIVRDGAVGMIIYSDGCGEVHLTDDKDILIYALDLDPFLTILNDHGLEENEPVLVRDVPHLHILDPDAGALMESLKSDVGIEESIVYSPETGER